MRSPMGALIHIMDEILTLSRTKFIITDHQHLNMGGKGILFGCKMLLYMENIQLCKTLRSNDLFGCVLLIQASSQHQNLACTYNWKCLFSK